MQEDFICLGGCGKRKTPSFFVCLHFSLVDRAWLDIRGETAAMDALNVEEAARLDAINAIA